jgi:outer membrane protein assembly factor BamB
VNRRITAFALMFTLWVGCTRNDVPRAADAEPQAPSRAENQSPDAAQASSDSLLASSNPEATSQQRPETAAETIDETPKVGDSNVTAAVPKRPAAYWPHWRGPNSDGISRETGWSADWPKTGLEKIWETNVGTGFSSVSIAEGRLFTMGHRDGHDTVYCLNADTGEPLWQHSYECELVDNLHDGGPGATPTIDADRVYTLSREGHLFCFDAVAGTIVWSKELEGELGIAMPEWGFTCSPLVLNQMLIVEAGRTVAFDKTTGERLWQTDKYRPGYGSPAAFDQGGEKLIAVLNNDGLMIVRARDGSEVDRFEWESNFATNSTTPIVAGNTIFISTGYNRGCTLLRLAGGKISSVYENGDMSNHFNNSVLWQGHLYGMDGNSHSARNVKLVCMNHETGQVAWSQRGFGCGSLLVADGKLLIFSDDGQLVLAEATPNAYREITRAQVLEDLCWTVPVLTANRVYCRNAAGDLACVELPTTP